MKLSLLVLFCSLAAFAQEVVFRGTPSTRLYSNAESQERQKLDADTAYKNECVIVQRGRNKYFWASRNNAPLTRVDAPQFTYFIHNGGAGYVKIFTGTRDPNAPADYVENINQGFEVITYWGRVTTASTGEVK